MTDNIKRADGLEAYAADLEAQCDRLESKHSGVRPGWVSADLAIDRARAQEAKEKAAKLRKAET